MPLEIDPLRSLKIILTIKKGIRQNRFAGLYQISQA